ncbi:MAG: hypothetical protein ABI778_08975 [Ignavibacteriota bacterium]
MDQLLDPTHVHLMITHLSIFGPILGALVLIFGMITKSHQTKIAALLLFFVTSLSSFIIDYSGEAASRVVKNIPEISRAAVKEHHLAAQFGLLSLYILGATSLLALIYIWAKKPEKTKLISWLILIISLWSFSVTARTGYLGGKIRHTELDTLPSDTLTGPKN